MRYVFLPVLGVSILFVIGYSLLNWLLVIQLGLNIKEEIVELYAPGILSIVVVLTILRMRIRILCDKKGNDNPAFGIGTLACLLMFACTMASQKYLSEATGKLTHLTSVEHLDRDHITRFYSVDKYYLDWRGAGAHASSEVKGKHGEDLYFYVHFAIPVYADAPSEKRGDVKAWLGVNYQKNIANKGTDDEKDARWRTFLQETEAEFNRDTVRQFVYLKVVGNNETHTKYEEAIARVSSPGKHIILQPVNEPFSNRGSGYLTGITLGFAGISAFLFIILLFVKIDDRKLGELRGGKIKDDKEQNEWLSIFIPRKDIFVTPILIDLNILVYIAMVVCGLGFVQFDIEGLVNWGANYGPLTTGGQWWRLISCMFLHGGLMHILSNLFALYMGGLIMEAVVGRGRFIATYIICGIVASAASVWWHPNTVSIGASGAIMGIYGAIAVLAIAKRLQDISRGILIFASVSIGYTLLMGLAGNGDNAAHLGGALAGVVAGLVLLRSKLPPQEDAYIAEKEERE